MIGNRERLAQRRVRQHHGEFLAAEPRGDILALDGLAQGQPHQPQDLVAGEMAEIVVE